MYPLEMLKLISVPRLSTGEKMKKWGLSFLAGHVCLHSHSENMLALPLMRKVCTPSDPDSIPRFRPDINLVTCAPKIYIRMFRATLAKCGKNPNVAGEK